MNRLHSSYHNLGSWKLVREGKGAKLHIVYNAQSTYIGAAVLFALCILFAWLLYRYLPDTSGKSIALTIISATGVLSPGIMAGYAMSQTGKKPLLTYIPAEDLLIVREPAAEIHGAYQRVSFSSEHFKEHSDHYFEFNIVIDGERRKFLSSIANSFKRLSRDLGEMGFYVSENVIKL